MSNSNLFLAFAENQRFARRKKSKKNLAGAYVLFLIVNVLACGVGRIPCVLFLPTTIVRRVRLLSF